MAEEVKTGGRAFPERCDAGYDKSGMTLRDYFAASALNGLIAAESDSDGTGAFTDSRNGGPQMHTDCASFAALAYRLADAMLAARAG